ncbi:hypothetical protein Tco_0065255 [Tanacetum coccineum]
MAGLQFVDQHNMVACLERSDENAEFHQIVDFLTTSSIHYALTVSPTIYASYIEQFWATAKSKTVNDVKQIHATVDGKTVVISESSVRSDLHFNDENVITCLSNDEIFVNLALMGYERVSTKLTFQKAFFSPQWKYLIHTILHCLSSKTTAWNEFSTNLASAVICLAKGQKFNFSKLIFDGMLRNLDSTSKKFLMYPRFLQLFLNNQIALAEPFNDIYVTPVHTKKVFTNMKRQNKDFSGRITPLFASMLVPQVVEGEGSGQLSEPQPPSSTAPPSQVTTIATQHQKTHKPRRAKRGQDTKIPQSSGPPKKVGDKAVYTGEDDRVVRAATTASSLEAEQESGNIHKTRPTATLNEPSPRGLGSGSGPRRQDTTLGGADAQTWFETASKKSHDPPLSEGNTSGSGEDSMEHQVDLTDFVPPTPHDSPLLGGHTPGSNEGRPNFNELINLCTQLSNRVLALENSKTAQDLVIQQLKKRVKRLENTLRARTPGMKLFKIGTSRRKGLDKENVSKQGRKSDKTKPMFNDSDFDVLDDAMENVKGGSTAKQITTAGDTLNTASINVSTVGPSNVSAAGPSTSTVGDIFEDEMTTIADTLVAIRSARPRTTSVMIRNVEEEPRRATPVPTVQSQDKGKGKMVKPEPTPKNPRKAQIQMDEELAQRLFEEEQAQFEKEQRIAREKAAEQEAKDTALIEQMEDVQARMDADELLAERLQQKEREQFTVDEQARMLVDLIAERKKFFAAQRAEQIRNKPPTRAQLRNKMVTYLKHMGNYTHTQLKSKSFEEIQKLYKKDQQWINDFVPMSDDSGKKDDSSSNGMLDDFDRQDVIDLYRLVKERYETTSPEGYDLLLWGDLKTLFEPSEEDEIWKNQQDYNLISWRLFDSCGVHVLLMDTGIAIHMMVENTYLLTQEMLSRMLNRRLEVDHESEMAFELLRFTRSQLQK